MLAERAGQTVAATVLVVPVQKDGSEITSPGEGSAMMQRN